jgi:MFS family permease
VAAVFREHGRVLLLGTLAAIATFVIFYLLTVFALSWGTSKLGYSRQDFLILQMLGVLFFGATIPVSALLADRFSPRAVLVAAAAGMVLYGFAFAPLLSAGSAPSVLLCLSAGCALMGLAYGPLGAELASLFPTAVRYTGASLAFNFTGILGGSLTPYVATWLATIYGLPAVGYYLSATSLLTLVALLLLGSSSRSWKEGV